MHAVSVISVNCIPLAIVLNHSSALVPRTRRCRPACEMPVWRCSFSRKFCAQIGRGSVDCTFRETSYCCLMTFTWSKMKRMEREMMPSASPKVLSCLPIVPMAKVFPDPVCPYAKTWAMSREAGHMTESTMQSNTIPCMSHVRTWHPHEGCTHGVYLISCQFLGEGSGSQWC